MGAGDLPGFAGGFHGDGAMGLAGGNGGADRKEAMLGGRGGGDGGEGVAAAFRRQRQPVGSNGETGVSGGHGPERGVRPGDGKGVAVGGDGPAAILIGHLPAGLNGQRRVEPDLVADDEHVGLEENHGALHVAHGQTGERVGGGGVAHGGHPIGAHAVVREMGAGLGGIGALLAVVVLVPTTVDQDRGVRGREAEEPLGIVGGIVRLERIVQQAVAVRGKDEAVAVGVLVVLGFAAAQGEDGVLGGPTRARDDNAGINDPVQRHVGAAARRDGRVEPDGGPGGIRDVADRAGLEHKMVGGAVAEVASDPRERFGAAGHVGIAEIEAAGGNVPGGLRNHQDVARHRREVGGVAHVDAAAAPQEIGGDGEIVEREMPVVGAFGEGAVGRQARHKELQAVARHRRPMRGARVAARQQRGGGGEAGGGDDAEVVDVEDDGPAADIDLGEAGVVVVHAPAHDLVVVVHPEDRAFGGGTGLVGDELRDGGVFGGGEFRGEPVGGQHHGDAGGAVAHDADGVLAGLEKPVPARVFEDAAQGEAREGHLAGIRCDHVDEGAALENVRGPREVLGLIAEIEPGA